MKFNFGGADSILQGIQLPVKVTEEEDHMNCLKKGSAKGIWLQLVEEIHGESKAEVPQEMKVVLEEFEVAFAEPSGLSPPRNHDHKIQLQKGAQPTCVRPYKYPYYQKEKIERLVAEMLKSGIIRSNQSPYSSPMLLVKKVDGSWQMCVDYRALNKDTVKDKYLIPNIDELLDELHGAVIFSKLDLR